jgi:hypothetical protein
MRNRQSIARAPASRSFTFSGIILYYGYAFPVGGTMSDLESEVKLLRKDLDKLIKHVYRLQQSKTDTSELVVELAENLHALSEKVWHQLPSVFPSNSRIVKEMNRAIERARKSR